MLKKYQKAFTLIEITVTIVIISIIATISIVGYTSIQRETRDSSRSSKTTVVSEALERYYAKNNEYPGVASLAGKDVAAVKQKLNILTDDALVFPLAPSSTSSIGTTASTTKLAYTGGTTDATKNTQCQTDPNGYCDAYQLVYVRESDNQSVTVKSRRNTFVAITDPSGPPAPPAAPTQPAVVGSKISASLVRFTASSAACAVGTVQYKIVYSTSSTLPAWSTVSWLSGTTVDINPGTNTRYYSQSLARCVSGADVSADSTPSTVDLLDFTPTGTAPAVTASASAVSSSSIQLSWSATGSPTISYTVSGGGNASSCTSSPCTVTGLATATSYSFTITGTNTYGSGSGSASATTNSVSGTAPSAPSVSASTLSSSSIQVSWGTSSGTATISYTVSGSGNASSCSSSPCTVSGLAASSTYTFTVTASNAYGSASGSATATTSASGTAPSTPSPTVSTVSTSSMQVSWTASSGTPTISYSVSGSGTASSCTSSPCTVTGLSAGTQYTFTVTASNAYGSPSGSATGSTAFNTLAAPTVSAAGLANRTTFSWSGTACPAGATKEYQYYLVGNWAGGSSGWYGPTTATSYAWIDSSEGYTFTGRVQQRCTNSYATGAWSVYGSDSYARPVSAPGRPTNFTKNAYVKYVSFNWDPPTCGTATNAEYQIDFTNGGGTGILWINSPTGRADGWWYGFNNLDEAGSRPGGSWSSGSYYGQMGDRNSPNSVNPPKMNLDAGVNGEFDSGNIIGVAVEYRCINRDSGVASGAGTKNSNMQYY